MTTSFQVVNLSFTNHSTIRIQLRKVNRRPMSELAMITLVPPKRTDFTWLPHCSLYSWPPHSAVCGITPNSYRPLYTPFCMEAPILAESRWCQSSDDTGTCLSDCRRRLDWWIDHIQVVTANNYNTVADFHTKCSQSAFTSIYLVTALNNGYSSAVFPLNVSWQRILAMEVL
jgi:hypothetical protein